MDYYSYYKCHECMKDAPYVFCCKCYCGEYEFCRYCKAGSRGTECPNSELLRKYCKANSELLRSENNDQIR